jgi:Parvovirus non-structural protein NS1
VQRPGKESSKKEHVRAIWTGKCFILRSIVPHYAYYGEVRGGNQSYTFIWQDCVDTSLIFIEEPMIAPEVAEQFKLVMEGVPTQVHVKMRGDQILQPTPVLITTNSLPWRWCHSKATTFKARMFMYE